MPKTFKKGDKVSWKSSQGRIKGKIVKKLTKNTKIEEHKVKASKDDPQYLVTSDKTGAKAAHKPGSLKKRTAKS